MKSEKHQFEENLISDIDVSDLNHKHKLVYQIKSEKVGIAVPKIQELGRSIGK